MEDYKEDSVLEYNEKVKKVKTLSRKNKATALAFAVLFATSSAFMGCTPKNDDEEEQNGSSGYHYYGGSSGSSSNTKKGSFWGKPSSGSSSYSSGKSGVSG
ncbi:hypothetical protein [Clostridium omnivorum]|uniref:Lipoprotein n=1 Tax=Clostridium omnivorum TaxID=1604902 RepID=A0ABQ5N264_9CLOT|nr:hypothetical protein [Clostridium sp. E14]GLC29293.1 hypothetical protein bsdE14_07030 [Clostridium sp. E14]